MAEATVQKNHWCARTVSDVPDLSALIVDIALLIYERQWHGALFFKSEEIIILRFQSSLP
jgi:hypothetical protein